MCRPDFHKDPMEPPMESSDVSNTIQSVQKWLCKIISDALKVSQAVDKLTIAKLQARMTTQGI